jgi:SagB-type dehydrogenase family enzyme
MEITELKPPRPWAKGSSLRTCDFQITGVLKIPKITSRKLPALHCVLRTRQSRRDFKTPLTLEQLGDLLWHSFRVRQKGYVNGQCVWESRPTPSGGGCHPIHVVVVGARFLKNALLFYDAQGHSFGVRDAPSGLVTRCLEEVGTCLKVQKGTALWFLADLARSGTRYKNPESLAWRDSGALLATISIVAEGLGLNSCGLGLHDIPSLRRFLKLDKWVMGVGGCVVAGRHTAKRNSL